MQFLQNIPSEHLMIVRREIVCHADQVIAGELGELGVQHGGVDFEFCSIDQDLQNLLVTIISGLMAPKSASRTMSFPMRGKSL